MPFNAKLIIMIPKNGVDLNYTIEYLNSKRFKENFLYAAIQNRTKTIMQLFRIFLI